jgi:hypothetical protein
VWVVYSDGEAAWQEMKGKGSAETKKAARRLPF